MAGSQLRQCRTHRAARRWVPRWRPQRGMAVQHLAGHAARGHRHGQPADRRARRQRAPQFGVLGGHGVLPFLAEEDERHPTAGSRRTRRHRSAAGCRRRDAAPARPFRASLSPAGDASSAPADGCCPTARPRGWSVTGGWRAVGQQPHRGERRHSADDQDAQRVPAGEVGGDRRAGRDETDDRGRRVGGTPFLLERQGEPSPESPRWMVTVR